MSEQGQERKEHYRRVRTEFDDLDTEDKVLFLMEATVSTLARGVDEFGRAVSDEINKAFSRRAERKEKTADTGAAPAEEPKTTQKGTSAGKSTATGKSTSSGKASGSSSGAGSTKNKASDAPASENGSDELGDTP